MPFGWTFKRPTSSPSDIEPDIDAQAARLQDLLDRSRHREDIADLLAPGAVGIELGVAFAGFAERLLRRHPTLYWYGVDMYAGDRNHDTGQYCHALRALLPYAGRTQLIRARFDEVVDVFPDSFFDFIYVDGYAHTGEEEGATFRQWLRKLKPFGILAGDDYDPSWPKVIEAVDSFVSDNDFIMFRTSNAANLGPEYPQWFVVNAARTDPGLQPALGRLHHAFDHALRGRAEA